MRIPRELHEDQRGLEGIEYLLIAALVIIASIGAWKYLGSRLSSNVTKVAETIDTTVADSIDLGISGGSAAPSAVTPPNTVTTPVTTTPPPEPPAGPKMTTNSGRSYHENNTVYCDYKTTATADFKNGESLMEFHFADGKLRNTLKQQWSTDATGKQIVLHWDTLPDGKTTKTESHYYTEQNGTKVYQVWTTTPDGKTTTYTNRTPPTTN